LIAAATTVLYATNKLIVEEVTGRMMTEPLHILLVLLVIFSFISCVTSRRPVVLAAAAALAGLDYLARPNGLFLMLSMMAVLFVEELLNPSARSRVSNPMASRLFNKISCCRTGFTYVITTRAGCPGSTTCTSPSLMVTCQTLCGWTPVPRRIPERRSPASPGGIMQRNIR